MARFLEDSLALANQEVATPIWFALKFGSATFGIFDAFADEAGRKAHWRDKLRQHRWQRLLICWLNRHRSNKSICSLRRFRTKRTECYDKVADGQTTQLLGRVSTVMAPTTTSRGST